MISCRSPVELPVPLMVWLYFNSAALTPYTHLVFADRCTTVESVFYGVYSVVRT